MIQAFTRILDSFDLWITWWFFWHIQNWSHNSTLFFAVLNIEFFFLAVNGQNIKVNETIEKKRMGETSTTKPND